MVCAAKHGLPEGPLGTGARRVLRLMLEAELAEQFEEAELVCDGAQCWVGLERTSRTIVSELLRRALIRDCGESGKGIERYTLNEDGRRAAVDPKYEVPELHGRCRS